MRPHRRLWAGSPACSPASKGPYRHLVAGGYDTRWAYHGMPFPRSWAGGSSSEASHHLCLNGFVDWVDLASTAPRRDWRGRGDREGRLGAAWVFNWSAVMVLPLGVSKVDRCQGSAAGARALGAEPSAAPTPRTTGGSSRILRGVADPSPRDTVTDGALTLDGFARAVRTPSRSTIQRWRGTRLAIISPTTSGTARVACKRGTRTSSGAYSRSSVIGSRTAR